jgi:hypothetical protein
MYVVKGRLSPEVAAMLMRAVEAASDALFVASSRDDGERPEPAQLRADALGLVAERALAAGFGEGAPVSGSRAERYQVVLHVEARTLREDGGAAEGEDGGAAADEGRKAGGSQSDGLAVADAHRTLPPARTPGGPLSELEDGTRVTAETARRLACDAGRVEVRHGPDGAVLDAGRKTRTVPPALRRALESRDRGCRFPGCGLRFTDAHHIVHWADGGETSLKNTTLLCRAHHRRVHEGGWRVYSDKDGRQIVFFTPRGKALAAAPPPPPLAPDPVAALLCGNRERGVEPDARAAAPRFKRDRDVPWAVEAAAREALDPWDDRPDPLEPARDLRTEALDPSEEALDPWDHAPDLQKEPHDPPGPRRALHATAFGPAASTC